MSVSSECLRHWPLNVVIVFNIAHLATSVTVELTNFVFRKRARVSNYIK